MSTDSVFDLLRRCRWRLTFVAAVRYAGITLPIAVVTSEAVALVGRPGPATLALLTAATIGVALAAAFAAATVGAPSLAVAARAVDRRLRLQDRMVTALQVADDGDPMATLVLRDAASRVAGLSASQTFPLEPPAHFRAIVAGAVSISVALAIAAAAAAPAWRVDRSRGFGPAATGGAQQGRSSQPGLQSLGEAAAASPSTPRPSSVPLVTTPQTSARATEPALGRDVGRTPTTVKAPGSRGGSQAAAAADRESLGSTVAAGKPAAGRGAVAEAQGPIRAAGGVKGEPLRTAASAADESGPASLSPAYAARHRTASARAQAAIAQERVPAGLVTYVKNYFIAIRP
ncbi:MAG TPA: hypothetical protein VHT95_11920 [Vicinamibacterales bacterium]|nr:hypothetical protein [Vicinamibacterales bacterium]